MVVLALVTSSFGLLYLKRVALLCLTLIHSRKLECLDSFCSSTSAFSLDDVFVGPNRLARKASQISLLLAVISRYFASVWVTPFTHVLAPVGQKVSNYRKYGILLAAEEVVRAGVLSHAPGSESVNTFHLSHLS